MFGRNFANYTEILSDSFKNTSHTYEKRSGYEKYTFAIKQYIKIFGIPEIGFQSRARYFFEILKTLPNFKPKRILDAGSGIGFYSFTLAELYPKAEVLGIDIAEEKLSFSRKYSKENSIHNVQFKNVDLVTFKKGEEKFDLIVNIDILEHIDNYHQVLKNFYALLNPGGYLYIHTPQSEQKRVFKNFFTNWHHDEHVREGFYPEELKKDLVDIGFKKVQYWEGFGFWGKLAWELNHITLSKNFILAGVLFPILYLISQLPSKNTHGLTLIILTKK